MRPIVLSLICGLLLAFGLLLLPDRAAGFEIEDRVRFGPQTDAAGQGVPVLRIVSTADIDFFAPTIQTYLQDRTGLAIEYTVASSTEVMRAISQGLAPFDVAISSAMDLQTKLANDGHALRHVSAATEAVPDWAVWNDMLFAFTEEPATFVVSRSAFPETDLPRTRHALISLLRQQPDRFRGRVGTYDIRQSGLGYLFATQDTRASDTLWRLVEVLGGLAPRLYCCSSEMIDAVKSGELLIAYNVLGSYVASRPDRDAFEIILPEDFTTLMLRTALIPANAPLPERARDFIDHLLRTAHGPRGAQTGPQLAIPARSGAGGRAAINRIQLGPGLLVFLDQLKREAFLREWENAILQGQ